MGEDALIGRRCKDAASLAEPGDYAVRLGAADEVITFSAILPNRARCHLPATGHGQGHGPEWDVKVEEDGTVTVDPSILLHGLGYEMDPEHSVDGWTGDEWHGWLKHGVWTP